MKLLKYLIFNVFISFSYCGYQNHQHEEISLLAILLLNHQSENNEISNFRFDISRYNKNVMKNTFSSNEKVKNPIYDINGNDISNRIYVTGNDIFPTLRNEELGRRYFGREITYEELYNLAIETVNKYFQLSLDGDDPVAVNNFNVLTNPIEEISQRGQKLLRNFDVFYQLTKDGTQNPIGLFEGNIEKIFLFDGKKMKNILKALLYKNDIESSAIEDTTPGNSMKQINFNVDLSTSIFQDLDSIAPNKSNKMARIRIKGTQEELEMVKGLILLSKEDPDSESNDTHKIKNILPQYFKYDENKNKPFNDNKIIIVKSGEFYHLIISDEVHQNFGYAYSIQKDSTTNEYQKKFPYEPKLFNFNDLKNLNHGYGKEFYTNEISDRGIGILPLSGLKIRGSDKVVYEPNEYAKIDSGRVNLNKVLLMVNGHSLKEAKDFENTNDIKAKQDYATNVLMEESIPSEFIDKDKYMSFDDMLNVIIDLQYNDVSINSLNAKAVRKIVIAKYLSAFIICIKMYPYNIKNYPVGIGLAGLHGYQIVESFNTYNKCQDIIVKIKNTESFKNELSNESNAKPCSISSIRLTKRAETSCKYYSLNIKYSYDPDTSLLDSLKVFKEKEIDENILPKYSNINMDEIDDINSLHRNSETIEDVWKELAEDYINSLDEFSENESSQFLINFNDAINGYKQGLAANGYLNKNYKFNVNENSIKVLESYFYKIKSIHENKFGYIVDDGGYELININDYNKNSQSVRNKDKLLRIIKKLTAIINKNQGNIVYGVSVITDEDFFSSEISPKSILESETLDEAIDKICDGIENLDDDNFNDELSEIRNELYEIKKSNDIEYEETGETSVNSEMVHKFHNAIAHKQGLPIDDDVKISENFLSVPGLKNIDFETPDSMINTFKNKDISIEDKEYIFNGLKLEIINSDPENERLSHRIYSVVHNLDIFIKQESQKINSFTSDIGHERYITDFISLTSDYNNLVAVAIHHGVIYSDKLSISEPIKPIELDNNILQRYNYIINKKLIVAIKEVTKNNPDIYDDKYEFKDAFGKTYTWGKSVIKEVTLSDMNNIRKDGQVFSSKVEHMTDFINKAKDGITTTLLKKSYKSRYIHTRYLSPASRNSEDISDIEINFGKINNEFIPNDIQSIRDYSSLKFYEAMDAVSKYNPYVTLENFENKNGLANVATLYQGAKSYNDMFDKMDNFIVDLYFDDLIDDSIKTKIEKSIEKFSEYNSGTRFKLALMVGRENPNTYNRFVKEFKSISTNVLRITKTSNGIGNNHQINSKMYEFKNINEANTKLTSLNKINKALKEIRLIKPTNIKKKINK